MGVGLQWGQRGSARGRAEGEDVLAMEQRAGEGESARWRSKGMMSEEV